MQLLPSRQEQLLADRGEMPRGRNATGEKCRYGRNAATTKQTGPTVDRGKMQLGRNADRREI